jgi:hypothetical protein
MNKEKTINSVNNGIGAPQLTPAVIKNAQSIKCDCDGILFNEKITFKKISSFLSPTGKEEIIPIPVMVCEACGKVPSVFDPQNLLPSSLKAKGIGVISEKENVEGKVINFNKTI